MWLCCANPILPKHPRRVHSLFLAIVGYTKRLVIAQSARSRSSRSGPEIRELGLHFVEGLVLRGDGFRLLFWQGFARRGWLRGFGPDHGWPGLDFCEFHRFALLQGNGRRGNPISPQNTMVRPCSETSSPVYCTPWTFSPSRFRSVTMPPLLLNWIVVPGRVTEATVPGSSCRPSSGCRRLFLSARAQ